MYWTNEIGLFVGALMYSGSKAESARYKNVRINLKSIHGITRISPMMENWWEKT